MARKQTRRTVSLSGAMIVAAKAAAASKGIAFSRYVFEALTARMLADGFDAPAYLEPRYAKYGPTATYAIRHPLASLRRQWKREPVNGGRRACLCSNCRGKGHNRRTCPN